MDSGRFVFGERSTQLKKSINAWSVDPETGFEAMFRQLSAAGFEGIELNVDGANGSAHSLSMDTHEARLAEIKALSEQYGLPVVSVATSLWGKMPMTEISSRALLEQQLKCARALGARGILTVPGGMSDTVSLTRAYENCAASLRAWLPLIEEYGLFVGLENVWNTFFTSPFDMLGFIDELGSPLVGAYYDVGNVTAFSRTEDWIEILGGRIGLVHVKDFKRNGGANSGGTFCALGKGSVDWSRAVPALRSAGFGGYLTAEVFRENGQSYEDFYHEISQALDQIISIQ